MVLEVGVLNAAPVYMLGLKSMFPANGYKFETVDDIFQWVGEHEPSVVIVDIRDDADLSLIVDLKTEHPRSVVVTLVNEANAPAVTASIACGASGAITRDASPTEVILALKAALTQNAVLPLQVARLLVSTQLADGKPPQVDSEELKWLQSLAHSATVASVGEEAGYSEREMYRRLKRVYKKMGVSSRTEALLKASRLGWIGD
ncbi:MAG TPA: hypothetical protein VFP42_12430 [Acidimicrobiia bacterium]|nr:hypothetical protein [Acidimicrobiia bacterium]